MKHLLGILFLLVFFLTDNQLHSQSPTRELGFRFTGFDTFQQSDIIFKKSRKKPHKFIRYRLGRSRFNLRKSDLEENLFVVGTDFAVGWEKRKKLTPRLTYFHGFEPALHITTTKAGLNNNQITGIELGYILGIQYDISEFWRISLETVPAVSNFFLTQNWDFETAFHIWDISFDTRQVALSVVYTFNKKTPEL